MQQVATTPKFYNPNDIGKLRLRTADDYQEMARLAIEANLSHSQHDKVRNAVVLVDQQIDFYFGSLAVADSIPDLQRFIPWFYRNIEKVTTVMPSMDTHLALQIFFPGWWRDVNGNLPNYFTPIFKKDIAQGNFSPMLNVRDSLLYPGKLETKAARPNMLWPWHTRLGSLGHALVPELDDALFYHAIARMMNPSIFTKGDAPDAEHFAIWEAVIETLHASTKLNTTFLDMLATYDRIVVCGQAKSHCVLDTLEVMLRYFHERALNIFDRVYILVDCTSSVTGGPNGLNDMVDWLNPKTNRTERIGAFEAYARERFAYFESLGVHLVTTDTFSL